MPEPVEAALAMFAKAPLPGRVKTRLASVLGFDGAAEFQEQCAHAVWQRISSLPRVCTYICCDSPWPAFERLAGTRRFRIQRGAGLGERMRSCLNDFLDSGYRKALIVGSDAPSMPSTQVHEALQALDEADVVLGPSADGGFTLIGATRTDPQMFRTVTWSRQDTRVNCLVAMRSAGLIAVETATQAYDVDTPADLDRLRRDPGLPLRLRRWLARWPPDSSEKVIAAGRR